LHVADQALMDAPE